MSAPTVGRESILETFEHLDSLGVADILTPTSALTRSVAQKRRNAGDLIGLPIGTRPDYRYPVFHLDSPHRCIHPLVRHVNRRLDVNNDPYGAPPAHADVIAADMHLWRVHRADS